jgi:hypothetical protein
LVDRLRPLYWRFAVPAAAYGAPRFKELLWHIDLPGGGLALQATAKLTVEIPDPRTPLDLGWSQDDRPLGIHLRSLRLE